MAPSKQVDVDLGGFLADLGPAALKGLVPAPIGWRADRLIGILTTTVDTRVLGPVGDGELGSALIHGCRPDAQELLATIESYRRARIWETRIAIEETPQEGTWAVPLRRPGERRR